MSYFFRNVWHMPAWRGHSMGSFPPPSHYPFSAPVTLGRTSPCPIGDGRNGPLLTGIEVGGFLS